MQTERIPVVVQGYTRRLARVCVHKFSDFPFRFPLAAISRGGATGLAFLVRSREIYDVAFAFPAAPRISPFDPSECSRYPRNGEWTLLRRGPGEISGTSLFCIGENGTFVSSRFLYRSCYLHLYPAAFVPERIPGERTMVRSKESRGETSCRSAGGQL